MTRNFDHIDPGNSGGSTIIPEFLHVAPEPKKWLCDKCAQEFLDRETLRKHRLAQHPLKRPALFISGLPSRTEVYHIRTSLADTDLLFENTESISINGKAQASVEAAIHKLSGISRGRVNLSLSNDGYAVDYDLDIDVLSAELAEQIEAKFFESSRSGSISETLRVFSLTTSEFKASKSYIAALQAYLTALIWKEAPDAVGVADADFMMKLGEALDLLEPIDRPLARGLSSLIGFMRNDFAASKYDRFFPFLVDLKHVITGGVFPHTQNLSAQTTLDLPIDGLIANLLFFLYQNDDVRCREMPKMAGLIESSHVTPADQIKLRLLLLAWYMSTENLEGAKEHYLNLLHRIGVGQYAKVLAAGRL